MYATPEDGNNCRNVLRSSYSNINKRIHKDVCIRTGKETNLVTSQSTLQQLILLSVVEQRALITVCCSPVMLLV